VAECLNHQDQPNTHQPAMNDFEEGVSAQPMIERPAQENRGGQR
jgi:hypothetical protein